jgi:hypothetical protein
MNVINQITVSKKIHTLQTLRTLHQMKSLTKVFVALLLAITVAFSGFSAPAHAQSPIGANVNISIDVNQTIEQILGLITSTQKFQIVIANQTESTLTRVGAYNKLSNWPLIDVPALTAQYRDWTESGAGYFTFAANYAVGDTGKYFQFGASWPPIGKRKINLTAINQSGNGPAETAWDKMSNADDKNLKNGNLIGRAVLANENGKVQWAYQVRDENLIKKN